MFILGFGLDLNLTINSDMGTIVQAMAEPNSGLDIRDRECFKTTIPKSFLGMKEKKLFLKIMNFYGYYFRF